jgi:hypothetical protein
MAFNVHIHGGEGDGGCFAELEEPALQLALDVGRHAMSGGDRVEDAQPVMAMDATPEVHQLAQVRRRNPSASSNARFTV